MKPTSVIFLILSVILIVCGIILCVIGGNLANAQDIGLLATASDSEGNDITTQDLSEYGLTEYNLKVENADVNIIGQSITNYIEIKNVNRATYDFTIKKKKLSFSTVSPLNITSVIKFRENGLGFDGLRHYLNLGAYKNKTSEINIYVSPDQSIDDINITVKNGNINIKNMLCNTDYSLVCENGEVTFEASETSGFLKISGGTKCNFNCEGSKAKKIEFELADGNGYFVIEEQYNFAVNCESGKIFINDENIGIDFTGVYPEIKDSSSTEIPVQVSGTVISGDFIIEAE